MGVTTAPQPVSTALALFVPQQLLLELEKLGIFSVGLFTLPEIKSFFSSDCSDDVF